MRRRITVLVAVISTTLLISFLVPLALLVRTLAEDRGMARADQAARNVAILVSGINEPAQLALLVDAAAESSGVAVGVIPSTGDPLGNVGPLDPAELARARAGEAFSVVDETGGRVYVPIALEFGSSIVIATIPAAELYSGVAEAWWIIGVTGVVLLVVSLLIAARAARQISEPLLEVAATAHRLRDGDLTARAEQVGPAETREVASALNGLAERIRGLLVEARAGVGELAHRLRTPVTALRLDLDAVDDPELADRLQERVAALQGAIDVIVKEARREVREDLNPGCDLGAVVRERVEYWGALAEDQGRTVQLELPSAPARVGLGRLDADDVVDILIENVFAHTPEGADFDVSLWLAGHEVHLRVRAGARGSPHAAPTGPAPRASGSRSRGEPSSPAAANWSPHRSESPVPASRSCSRRRKGRPPASVERRSRNRRSRLSHPRPHGRGPHARPRGRPRGGASSWWSSCSTSGTTPSTSSAPSPRS